VKQRKAATAAATTKNSKHRKNKHGDKPKRPLTAYNVFFKLNPSRIINGLSGVGTIDKVKIASIETIVSTSTQPRETRSNRKSHR
jgi:hypothetical protein